MNCIAILRTNYDAIHFYLATIKPQASEIILNCSALIGKIRLSALTHYHSNITIRTKRR
jgi:hypothetical protein